MAESIPNLKNQKTRLVRNRCAKEARVAHLKLLPGITLFVIASLLLFIFLLTAGPAGADNAPKQAKGFLTFTVDPKTAESIILKGEVEVVRFKGRAREFALPPGQYQLCIQEKKRQPIDITFKIRPNQKTNLLRIKLPLLNGNVCWAFDIFDGTVPIIVRGGAYFVSGDGTIHCVELDTGKTIWETKPNTKLATPAYVYACANQTNFFVASTTGDLLCLDLDSGNKMWEYKISKDIRKLYGPPEVLATEENVYLNDNAELTCIDAKTGKMKWKKNDFQSPCFSSGHIYGSNEEGNQIVQYDAESGEKKQTFPYPKHSSKDKKFINRWRIYDSTKPHPVVFENKLFIINVVAGKTLHCYNTDTAKLKWEYGPKMDIVPFVAISDRTRCAYILSIDFKDGRKVRLHCLDVDSGEKKWAVDVESEDMPISIPIVAGNYVYFNAGKKVFCCDIRTGTVKWVRLFKDINYNGTLFALLGASRDKLLFFCTYLDKGADRIKIKCIQIEETGSGDWTTYLGNPSNSNTKTMPEGSMPRK